MGYFNGGNLSHREMLNSLGFIWDLPQEAKRKKRQSEQDLKDAKTYDVDTATADEVTSKEALSGMDFDWESKSKVIRYYFPYW